MTARKKSRSSKRGRVGSRVREVSERRKQENESRGNIGALILPKNVELFQPKKGEMALDILLYEVNVDNHPEVDKGELWYERTYGQHRNIGPEDKSVICPKITYGERCPICEEMIRIFKDPDGDDKIAKALRPSKRQLFNVIDSDNPKDGVQLLIMAYANFGQLLDDELTGSRHAEEYADFSEFEGGKTLVVRFSKEKFMKNEYHVATRIDFEEREEDYDEDEMLNQVHDLDSLLNPMSYEKLKALFLEIEPEDEEEEDEEEEEKPKRSSKRSRRSKDEDDGDSGEEEAQEDNEEPDEEEKEEKPKKKRTSKRTSNKSRRNESDDEEEEDDEETEEDSEEDEGNQSCPHEGTFGEDCDELDECEDCDLWDECYDLTEANKKKRRSKKK